MRVAEFRPRRHPAWLCMARTRRDRLASHGDRRRRQVATFASSLAVSGALMVPPGEISAIPGRPGQRGLDLAGFLRSHRIQWCSLEPCRGPRHPNHDIDDQRIGRRHSRDRRRPPSRRLPLPLPSPPIHRPAREGPSAPLHHLHRSALHRRSGPPPAPAAGRIRMRRGRRHLRPARRSPQPPTT